LDFGVFGSPRKTDPIPLKIMEGIYGYPHVPLRFHKRSMGPEEAGLGHLHEKTSDAWMI